MKKILLAAVLFLSLSAGAAAVSTHDTKNPSSWIDGNWTGIGYQIDSGETWEIELSADSSRGTYSITYPDLNCRGTWKLESSDGYSAVFIERIEKGDHACADGGLIKISKIDQNHISFSFFWEEDDLGASATLVRKGLNNKQALLP